MESIMRLGVVITLKDVMSRGMMKAQSAVKDLKGSLDSLAESGKAWLKIGATMAAMGGAILGALYAPTMSAGRFEHKMREVSTMLDTSKVNMAALSRETLKLSQRFGQATDVMGTALYNTLSAGISASDAIKVLALSSKAATAGVTDVNTAVRLGTNVLNAYKMPVSQLQKVFDVMFLTVKSGVTTFPELAQYLGEITSLASVAGVKIEELGASIAIMTKAGIRTPQAMTALRGLIQGIAAPSSVAGKKIREIGGAAFESAVKSKDFTKALSILFSKVNSLAEIREIIPEIEGMKAFAALKSSFSEYKSLLAQMQHSKGTMEKEFKKMAESPVYKFEQFKMSLKALAITIGEKLVPAFKLFLSSLTPIIRGITEWINKHPVLTSAILKGVAALGVFLTVAGTGAFVLGGFKLALSALPFVLAAVKTAWLSAAGAVWSFTAALLSNPITWVVVGIGALIYGIYKLIKHWETVKRVFSATVSVMRDYLKKVPDWLLAVIPGIGQVLLAFKHWDKIKTIGKSVFVNLKEYAFKAFDYIKTLANKTPDWLLAVIPGIGQVLLAFKHWEKIKDIGKSVFGFLIDAFDRVVAWLLNKQYAFINAFLKPINKIREKLGYKPIQLMAKVSASDIAKSRKEIVAIYKDGFGEIKGLFSNTVSGIKNGIAEVTGKTKGLGETIRKSLPSTSKENISRHFTANWREILSRAENFGKGLVHGSLTSVKPVTVTDITKNESKVITASWQNTKLNKTVSTKQVKTVNFGKIVIEINGAKEPEKIAKEIRKQFQLLSEMG